jgi:hypothetical protein
VCEPEGWYHRLERGWNACDDGLGGIRWTLFSQYTKHVVYGMTYKGDCGYAEIAVPLQRDNKHNINIKG